MVLVLGYMLMITELLSEVEYVKLLKRASMVISKKFNAEVQEVPDKSTRMWRSLFVRAPKEKTQNVHNHQKLCVSASV